MATTAERLSAEPDASPDGEEGQQGNEDEETGHPGLAQRARAFLSTLRHKAYSILRALRRNAYSILRHIQYFIAPSLLAIVAIVFAPAIFAPVYRDGVSVVIPLSSTPNAACQSPPVATIDADIAGTGIRFVLWAQMELLVLLAIVGHCHSKVLGVKEIGGCVALTHFSLAVALITQMIEGKFTSPDAIVSAMLLDAQGSAMSITLAVKDILASRWQVWLTIMSQTFGWVVLVVCVVMFGAGGFVSNDENSCFCIKVFWWGWLTDCPETAGAGEAVIIWIYLACRIIGSIHGAFFAISNTEQFHLAEKSPRRLIRNVLFLPSRKRANTVEDSRSLDDRAPLHLRDHHRSYSECPATVTFLYTIHAVLATVSMAAAHCAMTAGMKPSSSSVSVGQMMAFVVAFITIIRVIWLVLRHFLRDKPDANPEAHPMIDLPLPIE
ncbi:unnamed protein product [Clonostachys rosea f. rosea IK726]|uniref:Uncharacterized protein n=1 Tax=Clonostachys rosea f. rosea IK726 TaxID=1349383 RepID=A0ACA9UNT1_BIOOC|nr:unnamed protein product [Clonostachys rosea f. rosea IK726]